MSSPESPEAYERRLDVEKDTELTRQLLGALGLVDAVQFDYKNPPEAPSYWQSPES